VTVDDAGAAAILGRPIVADGQSELVGLPRGLPIQAKLADRAGRAADHLLPDAGMRHHQPAAVEPEVAHEPVEKMLHALA
jgi:hypothetical protein